MRPANQPSKIAFVSDYLPRKCGIATFTHDLRNAVAAQYPDAKCGVLAINDVPEGYDYGPEVQFEIQEQRLRDYQEAVNFLRFNGFDAICLQHEFGIYGGRSGSHVLAILREVDLPVVTTLHTILQEPAPDQRRVMDEIVRQSERLVVMTERGRTILREVHGAPAAKIDLIAHGIPDTPFVDPNSLKDQFGVEGKKVLLTFGLLSPGKGIEYVIRALPEIVRHYPDLIYIVLGATHPHLVRAEGESYRLSLERLAEKLGMTQHVAFYNRFVEHRGAGAVHRRGGHLHHPLSQQGAGHLRDALLCVRLWQCGDLDALLARRGAAGRGSWRAGAVPRQRGDRDGGVRPAGGRGAPRCDARTGLPFRPRDDLERRRPGIISHRSARRAATTGIIMARGSR